MRRPQPAPYAATTVFDASALRGDFPALAQRSGGKPLVYLDNAATTQVPRQVLDAVRAHYEHDHGNVHRAVYALGVRATEAYEAARVKARDVLGAAEAREIVFTRGTTEAINLVAASWGRANLRAGDRVVITEMEHHANIVPWQMVCRETGAELRVAPIDERGELDLEAFARLLDERARLVAVTHVSNVLGTVNPIAEITRLAHERGAIVLVDGALAAAHVAVDVQALGCDFYAFSGHKVYGPTGIGVLYGASSILAAMPPWQGGGGMVRSVSFTETSFADPPHRFEAGTPPIAQAVGLGAALDYLGTLDRAALAAHEADLLAHAENALARVSGLRVIGSASSKVGVLSFVLDDVHPHDIGTILDDQGIAARTGHHCAQPLMASLGLPATARASFALYNTRADVDRLVEGLERVREVMGRWRA